MPSKQHTDKNKLLRGNKYLIKTAVDAQRKGKLPVFIITEQKWDFEHAQLMGLECELNKDGEWDGFFLFNNDDDDHLSRAETTAILTSLCITIRRTWQEQQCICEYSY